MAIVVVLPLPKFVVEQMYGIADAVLVEELASQTSRQERIAAELLLKLGIRVSRGRGGSPCRRDGLVPSRVPKREAHLGGPRTIRATAVV